MATSNCTDEDFSTDVWFCTSGPIDGEAGVKAGLQFWVDDCGIFNGRQLVGDERIWDGIATLMWSQEDCAPALNAKLLGDCDILSAEVTLKPEAGAKPTEAKVTVTVTLDNCANGQPPYLNCGGPGPHVVIIEDMVDLNLPGCTPPDG